MTEQEKEQAKLCLSLARDLLGKGRRLERDYPLLMLNRRAGALMTDIQTLEKALSSLVGD